MPILQALSAVRSNNICCLLISQESSLLMQLPELQPRLNLPGPFFPVPRRSGDSNNQVLQKFLINNTSWCLMKQSFPFLAYLACIAMTHAATATHCSLKYALSNALNVINLQEDSEIASILRFLKWSYSLLKLFLIDAAICLGCSQVESDPTWLDARLHRSFCISSHLISCCCRVSLQIKVQKMPLQNKTYLKSQWIQQLHPIQM